MVLRDLRFNGGVSRKETCPNFGVLVDLDGVVLTVRGNNELKDVLLVNVRKESSLITRSETFLTGLDLYCKEDTSINTRRVRF